MKRNAEYRTQNAEWKTAASSPGKNRKAEPLKPETGDGRVLVDRFGLAVALSVSLRTVDRMLATGEIVPVRLRGWTVRFYVPDVVECLRNPNRKWGRRAGLTPGNTEREGDQKESHISHCRYQNNRAEGAQAA